MNIIRTEIPEVLILEPNVFNDERGYFFESFNQKKFEDAIGYKINFVQDNQSKSSKGVLRGLHYQIAPFAQAKLVRCVEGEIFDVAVDIRKDSPTFKQWVGVKLTAENKKQLWIPSGFAHGFIALTDAQVFYKTDNYYHKESERSIIWNDSSLSINWGVNDVILSNKDKQSAAFNVNTCE
jgi:dTDP-4-dehydrorhamnose 3,5-epimerase